MKHSLKFLVIVTALMLLCANSIFALDEPIVSDLNGEMEPEELNEDDGTFGVYSGGQILGGTAAVNINGSVVALTTGAALSFNGSEDSGGSVVFTLDGDGEDEFFDPEGLGGLNLTTEELNFTEPDAFLLTFEEISASGSLTIEVFTEDGVFSTYSGSLAVGSFVDVLVPYSAFSGDAEFNNVGAIVVTIGGGASVLWDYFGITSSVIVSDVTKVDSLLLDPGGNALVDPGDTIRYTITIPAASTADGVSVTDTLDTNTTLVVGSVTTTVGSVVEGNTAGNIAVEVNVGTLPASDVVITFDVIVKDPYSGTLPVSNQATVSATGVDSVLSDDPDDATGDDDPTVTPIELDTVDPVLSVPADTTVDKGTDTSPSATGEATATDNETTDPNVSYSDSQTLGPVPFQSYITRTWTATDDAGNTSSDQQKITIIDPLDHSLMVSQSTYGLFSPITGAGKRQLGTIDTDGNVGLLGTDALLDPGNIATGAGFTTYDRSTKTVYALGKTDDNQSRVFAVDVTDGSSTNYVLSFGTISTVVGIWWDEVTSELYGVFHSGGAPNHRQLGTINTTNGVVSLIGSPDTTISGTIGGVCTGSRADSELYFLGTQGGIPGAVYTVDLTSGTMSYVALSNVNYNAIAGMNYNQSSGKLYALLFQGAERRLAELNPDTGDTTMIGTNTIAGGGVPLATYTGVNTLDEDSDAFLFVGRYADGSSNVWAIIGVDIDTGNTTLSIIDVTDITANGFYGLDYAELKNMEIVDVGFIGTDFYIDVTQGTDHLKVTSSDDLLLSFTDVLSVSEANDDGGKPNRFLVPLVSRDAVMDFFRVEPK